MTWQQPIRPLEVLFNGDKSGVWIPVLFVRVYEVADEQYGDVDYGWEAITTGGRYWSSDNAMIRHAHIG